MSVPTLAINLPKFQFAAELKSQFLYWSLWLFIVFVSVWDCFLTFIYRADMKWNELNPMCNALIHLNCGEVTYLLVVKTTGIILVTSILFALYEYNRPKAFVITTPIACFQLALLLFLTFV